MCMGPLHHWICFRPRQVVMVSSVWKAQRAVLQYQLTLSSDFQGPFSIYPFQELYIGFTFV